METKLAGVNSRVIYLHWK